ncbi:MAG: CtsR family transcriptional regulator [Ruminococcus sp.]|nr:CtsR family transcriptional regulator [Ruminococcus sp.]
MRMSDLVAQTILEMLDSQNGDAQIKRNELATALGCVPSQINYVITSRFTPEQGYIVESRRGGGGYIRITRVQTGEKNLIMHIVNSIGTSLDKTSAEIMLNNLYGQSVLDKQTARVMAVALSDRALSSAPQSIRDNLRADLLKNMLITIIGK